MAFAYGERSLTKENILQKIDSFQLFRTYCPGFTTIDRMFSSEFREDSKPSCHIIMWKGDLYYKDFGEKQGYRIFDYLKRKFNTNYSEVLQKINNDFNLGLGGAESNNSGTSLVIPEKSSVDLTRQEKKPTVIDIKPRSWTTLDKKYWSEYSIPSKLLEYHSIKSISRYRITNEKKNGVIYTLNPFMIGYSIDYYWSNGVFRRKLYFPQIKKGGRFISNVDATIVQGWILLPKQGEILFITKSYKDILIFNLLGYWAIAPNNEHAYIPDPVMNKLKCRFKNIYLWFDNDEGGIRGASQFGTKFNLQINHNPLGQPKDPSDFVKKYSLNDFDKLITEFLKNGEKR